MPLSSSSLKLTSTSIFISTSVVSNASASTPLSSALSNSTSTSILNSISVASFSAAPSTMSLSTPTSVVFRTTVSEVISLSLSTPTSVVLQTTVSEAPSSVPPSTSGIASTPSDSSSAPPPPSDSTIADLPSSTNSTPDGNTVPQTTEPSIPTSGPGPTIISVTAIHATASGGPEASTIITAYPSSTLSIPVISTTTDPNGSILTLTPPLVTIWTASTESNGSVVTTTSVVANAVQDHITSSSGVLRNPRAAAGIFSVVGLGFACLVFGLVFCIRRHRRIRKRNQWLAEMHPQRPSSFSEDPFRDGTPAIRSVANTEEIDWDRKDILAITEVSSHGDHDFSQSISDIHPASHDSTFNLADKRQLQFSDIASSANRAYFRHSYTPSTPSIYPISLSPDDERISDDIIGNPNQSGTLSNLPPRPPRSHLREQVKTYNYTLPTPTESESSSLSQSSSSPVSRLRYRDAA